jgi:hypothetical protein
MKKTLLLLLVVIFSLPQLAAQESTFNKGDKVINLGIGLGSTLSRFGSTSLVPPLTASFEVGIVDKILEKGVIGVGGYLGYASYKFGYWKESNFIIGGRGIFHYPLVDKLDTYTGLMMGYNISSEKWTGTSTETNYTSPGGFVYAWFVGARYYFSDNFAGMVEVGYGIAYLNLGVSLKF